MPDYGGGFTFRMLSEQTKSLGRPIFRKQDKDKSLVGNIQRIEAEQIAGRLYGFGNRELGFFQNDFHCAGLGDFIQRTAYAAPGGIA